MMNEWILSSSLLIGAVLLGRQLLRGKISLRLQYALWALVLVRLLLPVQLFTSDFGAGTIARDVDISEPIRQVYVSANEERYEIAYDEAYQWISDSYASAGQQIDPVVIGKTAQNLVQTEQELDLKGLLTKLWLGGMAVMTAVIVLCNLHLSRRLKLRRWEFPAADCLLPVYVTEAVPTPCIFGLFRPVIYLTPEAAKDEQIRRHVLAHEQTHYRHADHIWSVLRTVCLVLHWYNPLVWLAVKASKTDAELACDEGVLARLGESHRGDYGRTLIGLTCSAPLGDFLLTATTMTGSAGSIRQRIRLLMARPRNTVLTLTAVILIGTLVVGCTFAGAPETTAPVTEPQETHPADESLKLADEDGILIYPGTEWGMTRDEVLTSLGITGLDLKPSDYDFVLSDQTFLGQSVKLAFEFTRYTQANEWGLSGVTVSFADEAGVSEVIPKIAESLGTPFSENTGITVWHSSAKLENLISEEAFLHFVEDSSGLAPQDDRTSFSVPASTLILRSADPAKEDSHTTLTFRSFLTTALQIEQILRSDPAAEVTALFGENPDPWYLSALNVLFHYDNYLDTLRFFSAGQTAVSLTEEERALVAEHYGKESLKKPIFRMTEEDMDQILKTYLGSDIWIVPMSEFVFCAKTGAYLAVPEEIPQLRFPEILACELLDLDEVRMIYQFPGEDQRYVATFYKRETWTVYSNQLLIQQPIDARTLTEEEIEQVNKAYENHIYDENGNAIRLSDVSGLFNCIFSDPAEIDLSQMIAYYPTFAEASQAEWELLKQKYGEDLPLSHETNVEEVDLPVHRYDADYLDRALRRYTGIGLDDLARKPIRYYLEETNAYYNFTSDANPGMFICKGGWIQGDGTVILYASKTVLLLSEREGSYFIQAHLPAIVAFPPSSTPMIPAGE